MIDEPVVNASLRISEKSGAPAEIYHFKQSGRKNWQKIDAAIARVEAARAKGLRNRRVLIRHALRNATIPLTTIARTMSTSAMKQPRATARNPDFTTPVGASNGPSFCSFAWQLSQSRTSGPAGRTGRSRSGSC